MSALAQIDAPVSDSNVIDFNVEKEYAECPTCLGERTLPLIVGEHVGYETCPKCHGWGKIREEEVQ